MLIYVLTFNGSHTERRPSATKRGTREKWLNTTVCMQHFKIRNQAKRRKVCTHYHQRRYTDHITSGKRGDDGSDEDKPKGKKKGGRKKRGDDDDDEDDEDDDDMPKSKSNAKGSKKGE